MKSANTTPNVHFERCLLILLFIAALSFLPGLFLGYIGEEALYTISSYEMWYYHSYLMPIFIGIPYWRPPAFNWLIIPIADLIGWSHMLIASRFITASATLATAYLLIRLSKVLFKMTELAYLIGLIYLTSDAILYHGWIAYADPLYTFFAFGAVSMLWLNILNGKFKYFIGSLIFLIAAFLTKALTVYFFYATMLFALLFFYKISIKKFFTPLKVCLLLISLYFPFFWILLMPDTNSIRMFNDILAKLSTSSSDNSFSMINYVKNIIIFPLEYIFKLVPMSLLFFYFCLRKRFTHFKSFYGYKEAIFAISLALINFLPYLLSPESHEARYIMMVYPLTAIFLGVFFWNIHSPRPIITFASIILTVKFLMVCLFLPIYLKEYKDDYKKMADRVMQDTPGKTLYYNDITAVGETTLAYIDLARYPKEPLTLLPPNPPATYFLVRQWNEPPFRKNESFIRAYPDKKNVQNIYLFQSTGRVKINDQTL